MRGARSLQTRKAAEKDSRAQGRHSERGAALITVVLMSTLLLAAGGSLIMVTSMSASNAADATAESQAYYAAEAGLQDVLGVLRGNVAPNPLFNTTLTSVENKITFRRALSSATSNASGTGSPRLTRWLRYDDTYTDRVTLNSNYSPLSGMAFAIDEIRDPDNSDVVVFSTSFDSGITTKTFGTCCSGSNDGFRLGFTPRASTTVNTSTSGASTFGTFTITDAVGSYTVPNTNNTFTLNIAQTNPWPMTATITCTLSGTVSKSGSNITSSLKITFPKIVYSLDGVSYTLTSLSSNAPPELQIPSGSATTLNVTLASPEPQRLLVRVKGYGPRNAVKRMQMLVSRAAFDYNAAGAIVLRSATDNISVINPFGVGNSAQYQYNGNDNAGGAALPAISVTSDVDYTMVSASIDPTQVFGSQSVRKVPITSLDSFLQTTDGFNGARSVVNILRTIAQHQKYPAGCTTTCTDRYFASGETPSDFGATTTDGLMTFVDGDVDLPPAGGAGLLIVTGTLSMRGSSDFKGLILVLGGGRLLRDGGGNGDSLGAVAVARFDSTGDFLAPTFVSTGSGNSSIKYDSEWVRKALDTGGPVVLGISEY